MRSALIGYTGFVGSNLLAQTHFDDLYNSQNIEKIQGKEYDLIVSAGTKAERWKANQDPKADWQGIKNLLDNLSKVKCQHLILISTVDVYPHPGGVDEDSQIELDPKLQGYGPNRYRMEQFVLNHFPKVTIVRCPQLFGPGLKKNFVYDLIYDNALDFTHKDSLLQWYDISNLWQDIQTTVSHAVSLINLAVEPLSTREIAQYTRGLKFATVTEKPPLKYNFQTKYGHLFGSSDKYIYHRQETLEQLKQFIQSQRGNKK